MFGPPRKALDKETIAVSQKRISNLLEIFHFKLLRGIVVSLADRAPPSLDSLALKSLETKIRAHAGALREKEVGLDGLLAENIPNNLLSGHT